MELNGYRLLLPEGTLDYFDLVDVKESVNEDRLNVVEIPINKGIDAKIQSLYTQNVPLYLLILWANLIEFL